VVGSRADRSDRGREGACPTFIPWFSSLDSAVACELVGDPEKCLASLTLESVPQSLGRSARG